MKLRNLVKVKEGKYLKNYELEYENKSGKIKKYEIVSHSDISSIEALGEKTSGVSIVALWQDKLLLLKEFRMGVNRHIYNLCAGMIEKGETIEETIARELHEETGLCVEKIIEILPPSYAAVAISDIQTQLAIVKAKGTLSDEFLSDNEDIKAAFYTKDEVKKLLQTEKFSSRAQVMAYFFSITGFEIIPSIIKK